MTWRLAAAKELSPSERDLIAAELHHRHEQRYELYAYVIMNDHVHVLLRTLDDEPLGRSFIRGSRSPRMRCSVGTDGAGESGRTSTSTELSAMKKSWDKNSTIYREIRLLGGLT